MIDTICKVKIMYGEAFEIVKKSNTFKYYSEKQKPLLLGQKHIV